MPIKITPDSMEKQFFNPEAKSSACLLSGLSFQITIQVMQKILLGMKLKK